MRIQYRKRMDGVEIVRCYGNDFKVVLPENIEGSPVKRVAAYAFSARKQKEDQDVLEIETSESFLSENREQLLAGDFIEEIVFPDSVEEIGNYIFYGCRELRRLSFSDSLMRLGSGAFTGCGKLRYLTVRLRKGQQTCVKEILGELWQRMDVTFQKETQFIELVFPEHYEEAVENTPARILFTQHHGTGNLYRQCFYDRMLDYRKYDELFPLALAQDKLPVLVDLVFCRLQSGYELTRHHQRIYEAYIREHLVEITEYLVEREQIERLRQISEWKFWTEEALDAGVQSAAECKKTELVGVLMNERHRLLDGKQPAGRKRRFEL